MVHGRMKLMVRNAQFRFTTCLAVDRVQELASAIWSDLAFDEQTLTQLKRDGLQLDRLQMADPSPYMFEMAQSGEIIAMITPSVRDIDQAATLLDLWRMHFMQSLQQDGGAI